MDIKEIAMCHWIIAVTTDYVLLAHALEDLNIELFE